MIRLNNVDFPTFGRPTMAMRGSGERMWDSGDIFRISNCGLRILGVSKARQSSNFEVRNLKRFPLPFWKISHQMIWDLSCLRVIYSKITNLVVSDFENQRVGKTAETPRKGLRPIFPIFFWD